MRIINYGRLARAMGCGHIWWRSHNEWPLRHCYLCGRLDSPLDDEKFMHVVAQERPHLMCLHHGGPEPSTRHDCLTDEWVKIPKSPSLMQKLVGDLLHENWYWLRVAVRYAWFTAAWWLLYLIHPVKAVRAIWHYRKIGLEWW